MCAQAAHASMAAILDLGSYSGSQFVLDLDGRTAPWLAGNFKKVCVSVDSEEELIALYNLARSQNIICALIKDAGLTEFGGVPTFTCIAVGPDTEDRVNAITGNLKLL